MIPPLVGTRCRRAAADMRVVAIFEHLTAVCLLRVTRVSLPRCPFPLRSNSGPLANWRKGPGRDICSAEAIRDNLPILMGFSGKLPGTRSPT
jgi:hypothetical protein